MGAAAMKPLACGLGLWAGWYAVVLRGASRRVGPWGPRWLALALSGMLNRFGCWYLRFSHDTDEKIKAGLFEPGKQYLVVWHPHGAFTITALYFLSNWWARSYPMPGLFVCVADLLLRVPVLAEFLLLCNARSGDSRTFDSLLANGRTVAVQPGGIAEQVQTDDQQETVFFPKRLGFIRLALKHGVPLLPAYAFGENQLYVTTPAVRSLNCWLYQKFKVGTLFVWGRGGLLVTPALPNPGLLPVPGGPLNVRWGEPVDVGAPDEAPSDEKVKAVFEKYSAELRRLFDAHKDKCLPPEVAAKGLKVVWRGVDAQ